MKENFLYEEWLEDAKRLDVILYMHTNNNVCEYLLDQLAKKDILASTSPYSNHCLCGYTENGRTFEKPKMALLHTLNGDGDEDQEKAKICNTAARKIIEENLGTKFLIMDYRDCETESFRKKILGEAENITYLGYDDNITKFIDETVLSLRQ
jgi:hypothetical protein